MNDSEIIDLLGGNSGVAQMLKISKPSVSEWRTKGIPEGRLIELAAQIEFRSAGQVTRRDLRPDDWGAIWPELISALHPWPPAAGVRKAAGAYPIGLTDTDTHHATPFAEIDLGPLPHHAANEDAAAEPLGRA